MSSFSTLKREYELKCQHLEKELQDSKQEMGRLQQKLETQVRHDYNKVAIFCSHLSEWGFLVSTMDDTVPQINKKLITNAQMSGVKLTDKTDIIRQGDIDLFLFFVYVLICKSLWIKASAKWLNVNVLAQ